MISFHDMTFCANSDECANNKCKRHWNDGLLREAVAWWGDDNFPVAMAFCKSVCGEFLEKNN